MTLLGGIEAGGTKFVCGVGPTPEAILETRTIPTSDPATTLAAVAGFFKDAAQRFGPVASVGVASFGPLDLDPASPAFGSLTLTPKPGWSGFDLRGYLVNALGAPVAVETDVAGAGLAEALYGAGRGVRVLAYITVGTGVGGALIVDGRLLPSPGHPEMGHIAVRRHAEDASFRSVCPFHEDCVEGLASGPAILARYGGRLSELPAGSLAHEVAADYLAQLCRALALIAAPERLVLGGGVMATPFLLENVRREVKRQNNGYLRALDDAASLDRMIVAPALGDRSGLIGALVLAQSAASGMRHA